MFSKIRGAEAGLRELASSNTPAMKKNHLFYSIRADLKASAGLKAEAFEDLRRAAHLAENAVERRFLERKM